MNTAVTSKEAILATCRELVSQKGLAVLNMRTVAKSCGVALGSLYYYFPSKNELLIATIESVWEDIFKFEEMDLQPTSFPEFINRYFDYIQRGIRKYPHFFTIHSISFSTKGQEKVQDAMKRYMGQIKERMLRALQTDKNIRPDAFTEIFAETAFVEYVLSSMVCLLVQKKQDCGLLLEMIRRSLYS